MLMQTMELIAMLVDDPYPLSMNGPGTVSSITSGHILTKMPAQKPKINLPTKIILKFKVENDKMHAKIHMI